jgi:hypothetical protein
LYDAARLMAMHFDRKAVDVDRHAPRGMIAAGRAEMTFARFGETVAERGAVARRERENVDQPRLRRLTGQPFVERLFAAAIPDGQLHRRIVRQTVGVVLRGVAQRQSVQAFAQQLDQFVANQLLPPRVEQPRGQMFGDAQPMIGLAQQQRAAVGSDPLVGSVHLDSAIESRLE